ncbi:hypothetical protein LCGC14_0594250 [marine sediment metagenome]|uniref:Uncharacterized protein n=1 Tax=marine sediment metagenome TaxID=412755 RepID=A0A0F9UKY6_9ZZZZ
MAILTSYDDPDNGVAGYITHGAIDGASTSVVAQGFKISGTNDLETVQVRLYKFDGAPGTLTCEIRNVDGGGPGETVYATATYNGNLITATTPPGELVTFTFAAPYYTLIGGTQYCWVVWAESGDSENTVKTVRIGSSQYADGIAYNDAQGGASWNQRTAEEFMFTVGGTASTVSPPTTDRSFNKKLVVVGSDTVFYESASALTELTAARDGIDCTNLLQITPAYQKVFIANETNLKVADFGNVKITTANLGSNPPDKGTLLTGGTSGAKMVVDYITTLSSACVLYGQRITAATFTAETVTGTDDDGNAISFTGTAEVARPHWYDWTVYGGDSSYGAMPNFASLICLYRGRVVISGNKEYSFQWYMARQNHPFDFNYAKNDAQTAVAGSNADAGELGDIVTALIPFKDDYLVFGCGSQIWYMAGDPAAGGSLNELDLTTGIYGPQAWCFDNAENLYFWGTNGVYKTTIPGVPINISRAHLPNLVKDEAVDSSTHRITLEYDPRRNGILIAITKFSDNTHSNYFYDLLTQGFFPESSHANCAVYSQLFYQGDAPDYRRLLVGCSDGYIRYYDEDTKSDVLADDTANAINAYCTWGPLKLAQNDDYYGLLTSLEVITAGGASGGSQSDSSDVSFNLFVADTAEEILEKLSANTDYRVTGVITAPGRPKGSKIKRRLRGMFLGIRLWNSTAAQTWAVNKIIGTIKKSGRFR